MPLVKATLKQDIKSLLSSMYDETDKEKALEKFSTELSNVIDSYIKTATVTVQPGQLVTTNTGAGSTTTPGTGSLT